MLLINRNRAVCQEALIDAAWGESPAATARARRRPSRLGRGDPQPDEYPEPWVPIHDGARPSLNALSMSLMRSSASSRFRQVEPAGLRTSAAGSEIAPTVVTSQTTIVVASQDAKPWMVSP
jgi:hypothetical protein